MAEIYTYGEAVREALHDELQNDDSVIFMGEDIRYNLYAYSYGLYEKFGGERIIDIPLSEAAVTGTAIGAAMCGMRPVLDLTISNFLYTAMDQIVNMAAKMSYQYSGKMKVPLTILVSSAYGGNAGPQHSDRPHAMFMNVPGLKIIVPCTPQDMYSLLRSGIQDDGPVLCFQDKNVFYQKGVVGKDIKIPLGECKILLDGSDVTLIGIQNCSNLMFCVAERLKHIGISCEVIDVRSLVPFDQERILLSVKKTGRVVIADSANRTCSAAANISSVIMENVFKYLKAPVKIIAAEDVPLPYAASIEQALIPTEEKIETAVRDVIKDLLI